MRNSIYLSKKPVELRADLLMEYARDFREIWCHVPPTEKRHSRLDSICEDVSAKYGSPGALGVLYFYDVLGEPYYAFKDAKLAPGLNATHSVGEFVLSVPAWKGSRAHSEFMECFAELARRMEEAYGNAWLVEMSKRSDSVYAKFGFDDDEEADPALFDPDVVRPGNDMKFLCDCGQFKGFKRFRGKCGDFALGPDGRTGLGFYYNDSERHCHDFVSLGNGKFFRNMGYVDRGYVSDRHHGYSYYVRARNLDEKKITVIPRIGCSADSMYEPANAFGSVEEFALERAASGGLKLGDACYLYRVVVGPDGERRSSSATACWDGGKWIDFYSEAEIKDWPELKPGWKPA